MSSAWYQRWYLSFYRDVDEVIDLMDYISERHENDNEIANAISTSVGFGQDIDQVT